MCGIGGVMRLDGALVTRDEIAAMNALQHHRGPDSSGVHVGGAIGLGHTRLAVMDPTPAGHQPMGYADGRYWLSYNGEIYNFLEIRDELEGLGHRFRGESDTEVVVAAFAEWGEACQQRFNGMWAFAVWDARDKRLFLSRDRFGVRPLNYYYDGKRFAFASELKAFLGLPWFEAVFDDGAVATALQNFQAFEGLEPTLLRHVKRLPAGHCLWLEAGKAPEVRRWWRTLDHLTEIHPDPRRQAEHLRELLFDACALRMRSDIPLGSAVSGGLDSGVVHCIMAALRAQNGGGRRQAKDWDRAVVCLLSGWAEEDRALAEDVIRHAGTKGIFKELRTDDALPRLDDLIFHFEQIAPVPIGQWLLYRGLRESNLLVSMEGHGAEEAFAGYRFVPKLAALDTLGKLQNYVEAMQRVGAKGKAELLDPDLVSLVGQLPASSVEVKVGKVAGSEFITAEPYPMRYRIWDEDIADLSRFDGLTRSLYLQFHCHRTPWILHDFETASTAHGVENRSPFLDWRVMCYGFSLLTEAKIRNGLTKYLVREAMTGLMPESVRTRRKKVGFPLPLYSWFKDSLKDYILDCATSRAFLDSAIWNGPAVSAQVEAAYANGQMGVMRYLWSYIQANQLITNFKSKGAELRATARQPEPIAAQA